MFSPSSELKDGYDLPVYGLDNGLFYYLHVPALICILCSFSCACAVIILSFRHKGSRKFFSWTIGERFAVYLAICDGGFNLFHSMDHMQYTITRDHVRPIELCEFYGFMLAEFVAAQILLVNVVAINAFVLMVYKKKMNFGKKDFRLLVWTFGVPFVGATSVAVTGQLGPNRISCYFDGVKAEIASIAFTTVPLLVVLIINIVMYGITLYRIKIETNFIKLGLQRRHDDKSKRAAIHMSMFVSAFFIQWGPLALTLTWALVSNDRPFVLYHIVTVFSNIGGCLNLCIYLIIRHSSSQNRHRSNEHSQIDSHEIKETDHAASSHSTHKIMTIC